MSDRCPICFNKYPSWSPGVCPTCSRNERDARRYGVRYRSSTEKYGRSGSVKLLSKREIKGKNKKEEKARRPPHVNRKTLRRDSNWKYRNPSKEELIYMMKNFNMLLNEIYEREVRISDILLFYGVSVESVNAWKSDVAWICNFLKRFECLAVEFLEQICSRRDLTVLLMNYGITYRYPTTFISISKQVGIPVSNVKSTIEGVILKLKSPKGRDLFERAILKASGNRIGD